MFFQKEVDQLDLIVLMRFGSHLYGTGTENSDSDYKGVFMPTIEQILLGNIPKSYHWTTKKTKEEGVRNSSDDEDIEIYSLHYFIKLACEGQTVALDMLHAPDNMVINNSLIWEEILWNRKRFYTKNLQAFIGYAKRQASKYGIKGSRLNDVGTVIDFMENYAPESKLRDIWDKFPKGEHISYVQDTPQGVRQIEICGKILQETATIEHSLPTLKKYHDNYGDRAKKAASNIGVDWKAVSHACRAAYQVKELLTENTITYPLKEAEFLKEVKAGKLDYMTRVSPILESLMEEVEELSAKSDLPDKVDRKFWNEFIVAKLMEKHFSPTIKL